MRQDNLAFKSVITASEIEQVMALRQERKSIATRLEVVEAELRDREGLLISQVEQAVDFSATGFDLQVSTTEQRRPSWRTEFERMNGAAAAAQVIQAVTPTVTKRLAINPGDQKISPSIPRLGVR